MSHYQPLLPALHQLSPSIAEVVFTHRGFYGQPRRGNEAPQDYERLEFLGEGVIQGCISKILYDCLPRSRANVLKNERLKLTKKETLASFSDEYNFIDNIRCAGNDRDNLKKSVDTRSALFKSYVGGIALQDGFDVALDWVELVLRHGDPQLFGDSDMTRVPPFDGARTAMAHGPHTPMRDRNITPLAMTPTVHDIDGPYSQYSRSTVASPATTMFSPRSDRGGTHLSNPGFILPMSLSSAGLPDDDYSPPREVPRPNTKSILVMPPQEVIEVKPQRPPIVLRHTEAPPPPPPLSSIPAIFSLPPAPPFSPPPKEAPFPSDWSIPSTNDIGAQDFIPAKTMTFESVAKLNEKARTRCSRVEWAFSSKGMGQDIQWTAICSVKGEPKGIGVGQSKQVAKELAAQKTLDALKWK